MRIYLRNRGVPPDSESLSSKKHYARRTKLNLRNPGEVGNINITVMQNCDVFKLTQQDKTMMYILVNNWMVQRKKGCTAISLKLS